MVDISFFCNGLHGSWNRLHRILAWSGIAGMPIILFLAITSSRIAAAENVPCSWPQFHGPERDNISTETGLLKQWPEGGPAMAWSFEGLGHGYSSAAIADGIICTAGNINDETVLTALNMEGKVLWRASNGPAWTKSYPGSRSTPTFDGGFIYHQSPLGRIVCLRAKTGDVVWRKDILAEVNSKNSTWGLAESVVVDGDLLFSSPGGPETCMVALDKKTGEMVWKAPGIDELAGYASPVLFEFAGMKIISTLTAKSFIGVNAATGELLWRIKHESYADENVMLPIYHGDRLFISTLAAGSVQWRMTGAHGAIQLDEVWRTKEMDNHHGGVVLFQGNLYGTSTVKNGNQWVCLDWRSGQKKYQDEGVGKGSLTCADGMLYTLSIDRVVGLVRPTPEGMELVSSFEIPEGGEGKSWAHPVVCGGRLYIRHGEFLYVYQVR
jgi:outer membrane protein assembly factor BamB